MFEGEFKKYLNQARSRLFITTFCSHLRRKQAGDSPVVSLGDFYVPIQPLYPLPEIAASHFRF